MHEEWMVDVLLELRQFVKQQHMTYVQELIEKAFEAAREEFALEQPSLLDVGTSAERGPHEAKVGCPAELARSSVPQSSQTTVVIKRP